MTQRKITLEIVQQEFMERGYELLSKKYINNSSPLEYICPKHRDKGVLKITFANFTKGKGCIYCGGRAKKTHKEYVEELSKIKPNIVVLGEYKSLKTKIRHRCSVCNYEWEVKPDLLLYSSNGCPKCGKRRRKLTHAEFLEDLYTVHKNIEPIDTYIDSSTKIKFLCTKCSHIWEAKPNNILQGKGCPKCKLSKGESKIREILDDLNIQYFVQYTFKDCKDINVLPFDFYIPSINTCLEYDGIQHFEPSRFGGISFEDAKNKLIECQKRDNIKTKYCKTHNIKLVRIPYTDYDNLNNIILSLFS